MDNLYHEFKGLVPRFKALPIVGGLEECNWRWKTRWQRHYNAADQKRFSWMQMLTKAIDGQVASKGRELKDVVARFEAYFIHKKRSFCGLIAMCQAEGWMEKKAPQ